MAFISRKFRKRGKKYRRSKSTSSKDYTRFRNKLFFGTPKQQEYSNPARSSLTSQMPVKNNHPSPLWISKVNFGISTDPRERSGRVEHRKSKKTGTLLNSLYKDKTKMALFISIFKLRDFLGRRSQTLSCTLWSIDIIELYEHEYPSQNWGQDSRTVFKINV